MTETTWHHKNSLSVKIMHSLKKTKPNPAPYFLESDNNWSKKNYCCDTTILLQMTLRAYSKYPLLCLDLLLGIVFDSCVSSVVLLMIGQLDQSLWWLQANGVASQVDIKSIRAQILNILTGWYWFVPDLLVDSYPSQHSMTVENPGNL